VRDTNTGQEETLPASALFIFIGAVPHTEWCGQVLQRDDHGFILTGPDLMGDGKRPEGWPLSREPYFLESSVPGIFVAGDVRQQSIKRVASAVGEGAMAVAFVHRYLASL
jgi:thioredoxin reductase (NADPH)